MTKVIVIEDEADIRSEIMDWLVFEGLEVIGAGDGRSGLAAILREVPDLILCDIAMPELNGHEVLLEVRATPALTHIPFIFLTAAADRQAVRQAMNMGADDYITKPFSHDEVLTTVRSRLNRLDLLTQQQQQQMSVLNEALEEERARRLLKSRLVAMFSHDFRNPLAAILSAAQLLERYDDRLDAERRRRNLQRISGSVYTLMHMLDEMLMVAKMEAGHLEFVLQPLRLAALVEAMVEEFRLMDQNAHTLDYEARLPELVPADPHLLRHIVANLLSNALKYSPAGTTVVVRLVTEAGHLLLTVQDEGIGIPAESLPRLFQPYHRAENARGFKGTGLGLTIVKECVDRYGGSIEVAAEVQRGAHFLVRLPLA
ncbi:MAG: ATP-binding protein [Anaerolineae bacterium]|jgi:signal transduction histidine kinase|nr:ATP-binding protein [Anaerolineae bacterium]